MRMPEPDRAVIARRGVIAAALGRIVPGEGVISDADELITGFSRRLRGSFLL